MRSSIESFCAMKPRLGGKRVAVIGEMHIGETASRSTARSASSSPSPKIDYLFCYGEQAKYVYEEAVKNGFRQPRAGILNQAGHGEGAQQPAPAGRHAAHQGRAENVPEHVYPQTVLPGLPH